MVVKEFRQAMKEKLFLIPFILIHLLMLGALVLEWDTIQAVSGGGAWNTARMFGSNAFWVCSYAVIAYLMPLRGLNSLRNESHDKNSELLLMGGLSRWQIVRGKFFAQLGLQLLVLASLLPYLIVRYFFGAFDFWGNAAQLMGLIGTSSALSGLVIGISGYANFMVKISLLALAMLWLTAIPLLTSSIIINLLPKIGTSLTEFWTVILGSLYFIELNALLTLIGLQLGRAHLKLYLVPWEPSPTRSMVTLLVLMPFLLAAGTVATCGYGGVLVQAVVIHALLVFDNKSEKVRKLKS